MSKSVTRADVAKAAGVAESTVSRALNDSPLISDPIKQKVKRVAHSLGYYPSRTATLFAKNKSFCIGFVCPHYNKIKPFSRAYFPSLLDGVIEGVTERKYQVNIVIDQCFGQYRSYDELINSHAVDGLIFSITDDNFSPIFKLMDTNLPFVLVNNYFQGASSVYARPDKGMHKAMEYLYNNGHTNVGYITGDLNFKNGKDRLSNFENLAHKFHMNPKIVKGNFSKSSGFNAFNNFKDNMPSVVMAACDRQAFGFMQACTNNDLIIPKDVQVVGYDNFYPAAINNPPLTTISHPIFDMGIRASNLLIDLIERKDQNKQIWYDTDFVIRQSTMGNVK
jgi:LacI family transcriptional regulator